MSGKKTKVKPVLKAYRVDWTVRARWTADIMAPSAEAARALFEEGRYDGAREVDCLDVDDVKIAEES